MFSLLSNDSIESRPFNSKYFSIFPSFMESHLESIQEETIVKPFRVSVEGNIGAGKSTFIKHFCTFPDVDIHMVR